MEAPATGAPTSLKRIVEVAKALNAEVLAAHVFQLLPRSPAIDGLAPIPFSDDWQLELRNLFESEWGALLKAAGVHYRTIFEAGSPAPTLIAIAQRERAHLVVTGTRGLGGFTEPMRGSVSHQLVLHASVPVVVIPAEAREAKTALHTTEEPASAGRGKP